MKYTLVILSVALMLVGCGPSSKLDTYSDQALRVCGKNGVAFVNVDEGRYGCKGGAFSHDH